MAVPHLRRNLTGVISTGNGNSIIDSTIAEELAEKAMATAEEALKTVKNLETVSATLKNFDNKLEAEIMRSTTFDQEHDEEIQKLKMAAGLNIEFLDNLSSDELWTINQNTNL